MENVGVALEKLLMLKICSAVLMVLLVLSVILAIVKRLFVNQIPARTTGHVILTNSSFHFALALIPLPENIVKLKKSSLILAMIINAIQLELSVLQMAKVTHVTVVTVVTLVTCVTFLRVTLLIVVTMGHAVLLMV